MGNECLAPLGGELRVRYRDWWKHCGRNIGAKIEGIVGAAFLPPPEQLVRSAACDPPRDFDARIAIRPATEWKAITLRLARRKLASRRCVGDYIGEELVGKVDRARLEGLEGVVGSDIEETLSDDRTGVDPFVDAMHSSADCDSAEYRVKHDPVAARPRKQRRVSIERA